MTYVINEVVTRGGMMYFITFVGKYSKVCYVYQKKKDVVFEVSIIRIEVENLTEKKIKRLRSNKSGEYISIDKFTKNRVIIYEDASLIELQNGNIDPLLKW